MSIIFAVGSEDQLRRGLPWCRRFASESGLPLNVVIVGTDRKVLLKHAETTLRSEPEPKEPNQSKQLPQPGTITVHEVAEEAEEVLAVAKRLSGRVLVMVKSTDGIGLQQSVFESSPIVAIWVNAAGEPPTDRSMVHCGLSQTQLITTNVCERFLGLIPSRVLVHEKLVRGDDQDHSVACVYESLLGSQLGKEDVLCIGVTKPQKSDPAYQLGLKVLDECTDTNVALISDGDSIGESIGRNLSSRVRDWVASVAPPMARDERLELVQRLESGSKPNLEFLGLISASSMLAAFGLLQDSAAVIIGAMLIAPLMTPILGVGLSLSLGNRPLFKEALLTILLGFVGALGASVMFGWLVVLTRQSADSMEWVTPEMWSRCRPSPLDFCVGLVGGVAAAYAQTRKHLSSALAGAAIAAALVPPISTAGLQLAFGVWGTVQGENVPAGVMPVLGPLLLVTVNVLTIMVGASFVLWSRGMRTDKTGDVRAKWVPRVVFLLLFLIALILVGTITPYTFLPSDG